MKHSGNLRQKKKKKNWPKNIVYNAGIPGEIMCSVCRVSVEYLMWPPFTINEIIMFFGSVVQTDASRGLNTILDHVLCLQQRQKQRQRHRMGQRKSARVLASN